MEELKPCPFCGGEASLMRSNTLYKVECKDCGVAGNVRVFQSDAIAAWNTRVERTCERGDEFWECSECGEHGLRSGWNYCPNCGAKVVG